jgi:hypothetical protein
MLVTSVGPYKLRNIMYVPTLLENAVFQALTLINTTPAAMTSATILG